MRSLGIAPQLTAMLAAAGSAALSAFLIADTWRISSTADAVLVASYRGQAPEDILGFGFWPAWVIFALAQAALLAIAFRYLPLRARRFMLPLLLAVFALASILDYSSFQREQSLVFSRT